jgi:hypothetical protein
VRDIPRVIRFYAHVAACFILICSAGSLVAGPLLAQDASQSAPPTRVPPAVGTIKTIDASGIALSTEAGAEIKVQIAPDVKYLRVPPGSKDLKEATPIQLSDLQVGDRILVRGKPGATPGTFLAATIISMKKAEIDEKQARDRQEWQKHGIGGLVKSVDAAAGVVTIGTVAATGNKDVEVHVATSTILRRYATGSVKFDDAKPSAVAEIHPGDQLRARGTRSEDGANFSADEIVTGAFRNISGTVSSVDASAGTMTILDLSNNKPVEVKVGSESQLRKLPQPMAARIAMRLRGITPDAATPNAAAAGAKPGAPSASGPPASAATGSPQGSAGAAGAQAGLAGPGGPGTGPSGGGAGGGDLAQMLSRLPTSSLNDFQKGDAVLIVATSIHGDSRVLAITLLGGVEPILQASPQGQAASILSPWSLSGGGGGDAGTP